MNIAVNIMAVPERMDMADELLSHLSPETRVLVDEEHRGVWYNAKRAWSTYPSDATHVAVLQEDAEVCRDFIGTLERIVAEEPTHVVTLCPFGKTLGRKAQQGVRWVRMYPWRTFGVANVMPVKRAESWLRWCSKHMPDNLEGYENSDDGRLGDYLLQTRIPLYAVLPAPVQHRHGRSVIGHNDRRNLRSYASIPTNVSGLSIDWSSRVMYDAQSNSILER